MRGQLQLRIEVLLNCRSRMKAASVHDARDILNPKGRSSSRWVGSLQFMEGYGKARTS